MLISLIVPAYNEQKNIGRLYQEITETIDALPQYDFEIIAIDNNSQDCTGLLLANLCQADARWKYLKFSRNFGSEASLAAGLHYCKGDAGIILFSDLQDPPSEIPRLIEKWRAGYEVVYGVYHGDDHEKKWKRALTKVFYSLMNRLSEVPMPPFAGDFRLYDRRVINILNSLKERNRYLRGLAQWVGFRSTEIHYRRRPRTAGKSSTSVAHLFSFAFSALINFSDKPLKAFTMFGLLTTLLSAMASVLMVANYFIGSRFHPVLPGLTTTHLLLTFNIAFTSLGFGVLGEYVTKIYNEAKQRPLWIPDRTIGLNIPNTEPHPLNDTPQQFVIDSDLSRSIA